MVSSEEASPSKPCRGRNCTDEDEISGQSVPELCIQNVSKRVVYVCVYVCAQVSHLKYHDKPLVLAETATSIHDRLGFVWNVNPRAVLRFLTLM